MAIRNLSRGDVFLWLFSKGISDSDINRALNDAKRKPVILGKYRISYIKAKGYTIEKT